MAAFMSTLIKMSLRGIVIVLVVLLVRFLLKKLHISHIYILGLWAMAFLYFIFPWKLSLSGGFWNNAHMPEEVRVITEPWSVTNESQGEADNMSNRANIFDMANMSDMVDMADIADIADIANPLIAADHTTIDIPAAPAEDAETITTIPAEPAEQNVTGLHETKKDSLENFKVESVVALLWAVGLSLLFAHMLYTYFALKRKLRLSVLYEDNIWLADNIDMPMVFGFIHPQIYLPVSMGFENFSYVIAHEKMHIKRKDAQLKMLAYVICLIHWFNPFIWIAYTLFAGDVEKACDEEVIRSMDKEKRKEYAYALLHMAAENGTRKKSVFVAPICFDEGNVKSRIVNIMKYKYTLPRIGSVVVIVILALSVMFLTEAKNDDTKENAEIKGTATAGENDKENADADAVNNEVTDTLPMFFVADLDALQIEDDFSPEDYHITSRYTGGNHYYIDKNRVLWGTGQNQYGQLGTGTYGYDEHHEEPVRIADHVVSVDASWNDYFCIYLTEGGALYGIGENYAGILLGKGSESTTYSHNDYQRVTEPVLLMTDVAYARAGRECIVALKTDQTAYWWGQYAPATLTRAGATWQDSWQDFWTVEENAANPAKMLAVEPMKIMEHCKYITTGDFTGAAVSESGELYTWGLNVFGQCGTPVTEDDFVRTPVKVMDDVKMVWPDRIYFSEPLNLSSQYVRWETDYDYTTFILKTDDTLMATGLDLGDKEKVTELNGDIVQTETHRYSDSFVPVRVTEYSVENIVKPLCELEFGMSIEEVEEILNNAGLRTFRSTEEYVRNEGYSVCLCAQYSQYFCYFDSQKKLVRITIQDGGSRDGRFTEGMSLSDLETAVEEAGGSLTKVESDTTWDIWLYEDREQQIQYEFSVYEGKLSVVNEIVIK